MVPSHVDAGLTRVSNHPPTLPRCVSTRSLTTTTTSDAITPFGPKSPCGHTHIYMSPSPANNSMKPLRSYAVATRTRSKTLFSVVCTDDNLFHHFTPPFLHDDG